MKREKMYFRLIGSYLALCLMLLGSFPGEVFAGMVPSHVIYSRNGSDRGDDLEQIRQVLETRLVSERMADLGLNRTEIDTRLALLDDDALHEVATDLKLLQKGSDGVLGTVIALLVIAILVVVLLQLSGRKVIIE